MGIDLPPIALLLNRLYMKFATTLSRYAFRGFCCEDSRIPSACQSAKQLFQQGDADHFSPFSEPLNTGALVFDLQSVLE